jgi:hypothetical protein
MDILIFQGQGYTLLADVQYVDVRWEVPVVLPLHGCLAHELTCSVNLAGEINAHLLA